MNAIVHAVRSQLVLVQQALEAQSFNTIVRMIYGPAGIRPMCMAIAFPRFRVSPMFFCLSACVRASSNMMRPNVFSSTRTKTKVLFIANNLFAISAFTATRNNQKIED